MNAPCKPSTRGCSPLQSPSWPGRERDQLPARSTLSRFLAALTSEPVQALRTLFLDDLLSRPLAYAKQTGGLVDRAGHEWVVFDSDGTREAARVSRLAPRQKNCPLLFAGWMTSVPLATGGASAGKSCVLAPSSVRPTVESRLGSFGNRGNGLYRVELRQALATIGRYHGSRTSSRRSAPCSGSTDNMARGPCSPTWLVSPAFRAAKSTPCWIILSSRRACTCRKTQLQQHPESQVVRSLYDCASCTCGISWRAVPRGGGDPSSWQKEESGWRHAFGRRLRTLLHPLARARRLPLPTSSNCICIVVPSSLFWQMKTKNKTRDSLV